MSADLLPPLVITALSGLVLAMIFSKIWVPFGKPAPGIEVHSTRLGMLQKLMVHRWHILVVLGLANLGNLPGLELARMPAAGVAFVDLMVILAIVLPTRYRFTKEGFALGKGRVTPWSDFKRYRMGPGRIQFETKGPKPRHVDIFTNNVQQQALRPIIKRYFRAPSSAESSAS